MTSLSRLAALAADDLPHAAYGRILLDALRPLSDWAAEKPRSRTEVRAYVSIALRAIAMAFLDEAETDAVIRRLDLDRAEEMIAEPDAAERLLRLIYGPPDAENALALLSRLKTLPEFLAEERREPAEIRQQARLAALTIARSGLSPIAMIAEEDRLGINSAEAAIRRALN